MRALPYLSQHIALKNIDKYSSMAWEEKSGFEVNYHQLFQEREYENIVDNTDETY